MIKRIQAYVLIILLFAFKYGKSNSEIHSFSAISLSLADSNIKHEIVIIPVIGYREIPFIESPISPILFYNNEHTNTASSEYGCSIDYRLTDDVNIGLSLDYQAVPFTSLHITQPFIYPFSTNNYSYYASPEFGCSLDYLKSKNSSIGVILSYQTTQCTAQDTQKNQYNPHSLQFDCLTIGIRKLFYFNSKNNALHFYAGARADVSIWVEQDGWVNGANNEYEPIIGTTNTLQFSLLVLGGMRYYILPYIGTQVELGYGFGTPTYAQFGMIVRLNGKHSM